MRTVTGRGVPQQKLGGWAALYVALAYVAAMPYFLLFVKYPNLADPGEKVSMLVAHHGSLQVMYLLTYVIFGIVLSVLALTLYHRMKDETPILAQVATIVGLIWALVLVASGMIYNAGIAAVVDLHATNPAQAVSVWQAVEPVTQGLGGSGGELLGGLWVLLVSVAALRSRKLPRLLNWLGVVIGAVGVLSVVPVLRDLAYGFGLLQILWFVCLGAVLLRARPRRAGSVAAAGVLAGAEQAAG
jgi:Domain of unknown function (DUF4386)